jgi:hypothetical protein
MAPGGALGLPLHSMPLSVVRIQPIVTHGRRGVQVGEALFSDGLTARFRISSVDPTDVQMVDPGLPTAYRQALRAWLEQQGQPAA